MNSRIDQLYHLLQILRFTANEQSIALDVKTRPVLINFEAKNGIRNEWETVDVSNDDDDEKHRKPFPFDYIWMTRVNREFDLISTQNGWKTKAKVPLRLFYRSIRCPIAVYFIQLTVGEDRIYIANTQQWSRFLFVLHRLFSFSLPVLYINSAVESISSVFWFKIYVVYSVENPSSKNLFTRKRSDNANDLRSRMGWWVGA